MLDGIEKIMSGGVCSCGETHGRATGRAVVGDGAADSLAQFIREKNFQRGPDRLRHKHRKICTGSETGSHERRCDNPPRKLARGREGQGVTPLIDRLNGKSYDCLVACGSGSLHDITRYSANEKNIPFVSFPTAASVDGFVSTVAAMTWGGQKLFEPRRRPDRRFRGPRGIR